MSYQDSEREFIELVLEKVDSALAVIPETKMEFAIERLVAAVQVASAHMTAAPQVDEALGALRDALNDLWERYDTSPSAEQQAQVLSEFPLSDDSQSPAEWSFIRRFAHDYARQQVFHASLAQAMRDVPKRVDRLEEVLDLLVDAQLSPRSQVYVAKTARLFVAGFRLEAVVLARAALESALVDAVPDEVVFANTRLQTTRFVPLADRIAAAESVDRLDRHCADLAREITEAANTVLHEEPKFPHKDLSAKAYLGKLRDVLVMLDRTSEDS